MALSDSRMLPPFSHCRKYDCPEVRPACTRYRYPEAMLASVCLEDKSQSDDAEELGTFIHLAQRSLSLPLMDVGL